MNKRKACFVGLAAVVTLLAGCVAQYRNPSTCEDEMRHRFAEASLGALSVTSSGVSYRGQRVVVEGHFDKPLKPAVEASGASAAFAAEAASGASAVSVASAASAASGTPAAAALGASSPAAASGAAVAAAASGASAVKAEPKPGTPVAALAQKLGIKKPAHTPAAAECLFNESGLVSFRWLAPPELAKTTPDPHAAED
ncbi:hypothetical protein [Paraburkholderia acidipaludis]|uniref:hypothetical protein n=1 Tax=Paraburkholderia acidipaludis TaxID=660537 RepID=UPI0005B9EAAE|nr:hypothetical protein [Paraburkholderia acidipaludis]